MNYHICNVSTGAIGDPWICLIYLLDMPDILIYEAETTLNASFQTVLNPKDREDLIEDARDRLTEWLANKLKSGE